MYTIPFNIYIEKVKGCYRGKTIGGTLGMPCEGKTDTFNLSFYDPIPTDMCANDDIDNQVVYMEEVFRTGFPVNRLQLSRSWSNIQFGADEYGVAKYHLNQGINPPLSGAYENYFYAGMGAAIRSELWACLAPGNPELAAALAAEDACIDHSDEGIDAEIFLAALESAAFVECNTEKLLEIAFSFIAKDRKLWKALHDVIDWWNDLHDLFAVREKIVEKYGVVNWTDITVNLCFIILGWLCGEGNFGKSICAAVNCGYDADCTGATLGALLGIINPESIEPEWEKPIGNTLKLSANITGIHHSENINDFCDQVAALAIAAGRYYGSFDFVNPDPQIEALSQTVPVRTRHSELYAENRKKTDSLLCDSPLLITLRYPESICAAAHAGNRFTLFVSNPNEITVTGKITLSSPLGNIFDCRTFDYCIEPGKTTAFPFTVQIDTQEKTERDPLDITVSCNGLSFELSAPLLLQIPWVDTKTGLLSPASGFYKDIPAGEQSYSVDFKLPNNHRSAVACYSKRKFTLSVNGKVVIDSLPPEAVPSVHRKSATIVDLNNKANHVTVTFEDGTPDKFFFGVGDLDNWVWYDCLRWKKPQI